MQTLVNNTQDKTNQGQGKPELPKFRKGGWNWQLPPQEYESDRTPAERKPNTQDKTKVTDAGKAPREHNYLRLLCASNAIKPYLEADINSHEPWSGEIDEFLSALDALQV
jgi:hypothetical protein